ncbi:MAG: HD domain-containing protein [Burkholderiales bacterium]|nr:HD domain-containing protein [Burkholderiales bacterium]
MKMPEEPIGHLFYTGHSRFLKSNEHMARALVAASGHGSIHAAEDICDANGVKLWARNKLLDEQLLERLHDRPLRKPIELCVAPGDPVRLAAVREEIEEQLLRSDELGRALAPGLASSLKLIESLVPNPTELLLYTVMRHAGRRQMEHAALVCLLALMMGQLAGLDTTDRRNLARAALLHDIGEFYLPERLFAPGGGRRTSVEIREIRRHPLLGAQVATELARLPTEVGQFIAASHERLDGSGYPLELTARRLDPAAQALFFAEAMAPLLGAGANRLRRAAVASRIGRAEFAPAMTNWLNRCAAVQAASSLAPAAASDIDAGLRRVAARLTRAQALLRGPRPRASPRERVAAAHWLASVDALIQVLSSTGVLESVQLGLSIEASDATEAIELAVLGRELDYRVGDLRLRVDLERIAAPAIADVAWITELLEILDPDLVPTQVDALAADTQSGR